MNVPVKTTASTAQNPVKTNRQFANVVQSKRSASNIPKIGNADANGQIATIGTKKIH